MKRTKFKISFVETLGKNIENVVDSIFLNINQTLENIEVNLNISQTLDDIGATFNNCFLQAKPILEQFKENLDRLPESIGDALLIMAQHGWYLDPDLPGNYLFVISRHLERGEISEVDLFLSEYFTERIGDIENEITNKFPHRNKIISSAFNAHRREYYELSIPILLIQIDSVCQELYGQLLFRNKDRKPGTAQYVKQQKFNPYKMAFLQPLSVSTSINMTENQREKDFTGLNRHMVLHGESLDYGTEINSLKAISLLNYVSNILKYV
ncbi:MAG: hypothetical protein WBM44_08520 [Waterburya sp.]